MWDGHSCLSAHRSGQDLSKYWRDYFRIADHAEVGQISQSKRVYQDLTCKLSVYVDLPYERNLT
jgi:hypothetical protein